MTRSLALFHDGDIFRLRCIRMIELANLRLLRSAGGDTMVGRQSKHDSVQTWSKRTRSGWLMARAALFHSTRLRHSPRKTSWK